MKEKTLDKIITKSQNTNVIRVLYKEPQKNPEVKIIDNMQKLKREIINKKLIIIPYESAFIVCNNKELMEDMTPNIALILGKIGGDFILVNIDKKEREFKSLSQEEIIWYLNDLNNKSFNIKTKIRPINFKEIAKQYEKSFDEKNQQFSEYNTKIINVLTKIEKLLNKIIKNGV